MTDRRVFKNNLKKVDRQTRMCLLYLENTMNDQFKTALQVKQPKIPKVDLSKLESNLDSLQKQINGLRSKVDITQVHIRKHHEQEIFLKRMTTRTEEVLNEITRLFNELYDSGYYSEGTRRKIREAGLIHK